MTSTNRAAVLFAQDDLRVVDDYPMPELAPTDVLVRIKAVGICGSDVHYWTHGRIGDFVVTSPMVIGHESAGVVAAVGEQVDGLAKGDRVALEPGVPCRRCSHCKRGTYNLCAEMKFFATPPVHGSLATFVRHPADFCFKLPDAVSLEEGAMCEPLSVGVHACRRGGVAAGSTLLILGAGPIGLVCLLVAKAFGVLRVFVTDVSDERLAMASKLGAAGVFNAAGVEAEEMAARVREANGGERVDVSIDCCGVESAMKTGIHATQSGGTVVMVGLHDPVMKLPMFNLGTREVDLKGIFRYRDTYPTCISLLESGLVDVKPLITHRFALDELLEAFTVAKEGRDGALKVMFNV